MEEKRQRGRPRIHEEELARVDVRLPLELRKRVRVAAAQADVGMGEWVKLAIEEKLERSGG